MRFDRIAVLLHDPVRYLPCLQEALDRAEIPAYFALGRGGRGPEGARCSRCSPAPPKIFRGATPNIFRSARCPRAYAQTRRATQRLILNCPRARSAAICVMCLRRRMRLGLKIAHARRGDGNR